MAVFLLPLLPKLPPAQTQSERAKRFDLAMIALGTVGAVSIFTLQLRGHRKAGNALTMLSLVAGGILAFAGRASIPSGG